MRIYHVMVAIDGIRSYLHVRADNMSQAFDSARMRANAGNPQSYVEVLTGQELRDPDDLHTRLVEKALTPVNDLHGLLRLLPCTQHSN
jgi:hypothetical protein